MANEEIFNKQNRLLPLDSSFKTGFAIFPDEVLIIRKKRETFSRPALSLSKVFNQICVSVSQAQRVVDHLFFASFVSFCSNSFILRPALRSLGEAGISVNQ